MTHPSLPSWPPVLTDAQLDELTRLSTSYALAHGLAFLSPPSNGANGAHGVSVVNGSSSHTHARAPTSAIHAPFSLVPAPFPRRLFEEARRLQRMYNVLYARIAMDEAFLDSVAGETMAGADDFTGQLWRMWKNLRDLGIREQWHLGIFRSDYLLHSPEGSDEGVALKQVEFNTISVSFGALSERVSSLHRYLLAATDYYGSSKHLNKSNLPEKGATEDIAEGLAAAHRAYGVDSAHILFVIQPDERNIFDQTLIAYELLEKHSIRVVRQTFDQLLESVLISPDRTLYVSGTSLGLSKDKIVEISVIYFRTGYVPADYAIQEHYELRESLSYSRAISCPTLAMQLAGCKKVQQALTRPGVLERFLLPADTVSSSAGGDSGSCTGPFGPETFTPEDLAAIRATWMRMWGLDELFEGRDGDGEGGEEDGVSRALAHAASLVLKPQREGGGHNVYRSSITSFVPTIPERERVAWIAMELIEPPNGVGGYLVKAGKGEAWKASEVVSELGIFGWALFRSYEEGKRQRIEEGSGGYVVRTKGRESDEGGVAVGFSVLDSVVLVD